jgi:ubiquitin carboxyl-terminal hydrolase 4/11/15
MFQFMYLTVPLPIAQHRAVKVKFVPRDPDQPPVTVRLLISQNASFQQLKERLAGIMKVNPAHVSER